MNPKVTIFILISITLRTHAQWQYHLPQNRALTYPVSPEILTQKIFQLRQELKKPQPYFARLPADDDSRLLDNDDADYEEPPEENLMQQQEQRENDAQLKPHPLLPVLLGMIPSACGRRMYNNHKEFCYRNHLYNRDKFGSCGLRIYKKEKSFCFNGETYYKIRKGLCGNGVYDKLTQICLNHQVRNICAGEIFDPHTHFCYERIYNRVNYAMCGKRVYKKITHYCVAGKIYAKRKWIPNVTGGYAQEEIQLWGRENIRRQYLRNKKAKLQQNYHPWKAVNRNQVFTVQAERKDSVPSQMVHLGQCGKAQYDTKRSFCYEGKVNKRCGEMAFNPNTLLCYRNFLYTRGLYDTCRNEIKAVDEMYNKFTQSCNNGHILRHDLNRYPQAHKIFLDYGTEKEKDLKEQQDIYNLSKQLEEKRRDFRERHETESCGSVLPFNKRSHFCYNGKLYNRSINAMCGTALYNRTQERCLGGQLFPVIDLNKPAYYAGGGYTGYNVNGRR